MLGKTKMLGKIAKYASENCRVLGKTLECQGKLYNMLGKTVKYAGENCKMLEKTVKCKGKLRNAWEKQQNAREN